MFFAPTLRTARFAPRAYDQAFERFASEAFAGARRSPLVEQDDTSWTLSLDVPGLAREDLVINIEGAVVRIESNWNAGLTGRAGEVGLMQIKHQTARGVGYTGTRAALYNPETNIKWGMRYLAGAYRLAGGDTCGTVLRYQGGHGATRMSSMSRTYCSKARTIMASN